MEVSEISGNQTLHDLAFYYIHFEITGYPRNMIGSSQCDLFMNKTIFCSIFHLFQANENGTVNSNQSNCRKMKDRSHCVANFATFWLEHCVFSQKPRSVKIITLSE